MVRTERMRLDEALVADGLAPSRSRARDMVLRGTVRIDGGLADRPARRIDPAEHLDVADPAARFVSRAAVKLVAGLHAFGFDPLGLTVLDLGASTGGFTQVLLARGAAHVIALDVGHGQLDPTIAADARVTSIEGLNARDFVASHLSGRSVGAIVCDVSFISLRLVLPPTLILAAPGAWGVFLVKPQFEVGRAALGKGGIVRDPDIARGAAEDIAAWLTSHDCWTITGLLPSPLAGGDGNAEFLLGARHA